MDMDIVARLEFQELFPHKQPQPVPKPYRRARIGSSDEESEEDAVDADVGQRWSKQIERGGAASSVEQRTRARPLPQTEGFPSQLHNFTTSPCA